jgi:glucosylceramidase
MATHIRAPRLLAVGALVLGTACASSNNGGSGPVVVGPAVGVWVTTPDHSKLLQKDPPTHFTTDASPAPIVIDVDEAATFQSMDGFGASLTESSASLIADHMTAEQRGTLLARLFGRGEDGIGLSFLRQPMGASDFALSTYSYDDTCCDLRDFSIDREKTHIVPLLQQIRGLNPDLLIMGTPWSPPGWMKTSGSMIGGKLRDEHYATLAEYFVRWIQAYQALGLPIYAVTPQNEPQYEPTGYPGMLMSADEQARFIKTYLGPAFRNAGLDTRIVAFDHNWDIASYALTILSDPEAKAYLAGSAFHCYGGAVSAQSVVHDAHPDKDLWHTECSDGTWIGGGAFEPLFTRAMRELVIGAVRNWAKGVVKWNLALDLGQGPTNGGCTTCFGTVAIDVSNGNVTYNSEYYALGHASKFVRRGALRIQSTSITDSIETVAFRNPDGGKVLVAFNAGAASVAFHVRWNGKTFAYTLPQGAAATFTWSALDAL